MHRTRYARYPSPTTNPHLRSKVAFTSTTTSSINSYGYSPHPLSTYLAWIHILLTSASKSKPIIISITASDPATLTSMVDAIQVLRFTLNDIPHSTVTPTSPLPTNPSTPTNAPTPLPPSTSPAAASAAPTPPSRIAIELNTSCPNIPSSPPSGYDFPSLLPLLQVLADTHAHDNSLTIGLKLPPFIFREQFTAALAGIDALAPAPSHHALTSHTRSKSRNPIAFLTSTNTLGNSLLFPEQTQAAPTLGLGPYALPNALGLGGLAGDALHPLALGNIHTFAQLLRERKSLGEGDNRGEDEIVLIGVGGVTSPAAVERMRRAGAGVVGCATLFGREGVRAFEILSGVEMSE